jgi:hypothetical protein
MYTGRRLPLIPVDITTTLQSAPHTKTTRAHVYDAVNDDEVFAVEFVLEDGQHGDASQPRVAVWTVRNNSVPAVHRLVWPSAGGAVTANKGGDWSGRVPSVPAARECFHVISALGCQMPDACVRCLFWIIVALCLRLLSDSTLGTGLHPSIVVFPKGMPFLASDHSQIPFYTMLHR